MSLLAESTVGAPRVRRPSRSRGVVLRAIDQMGHPFSVGELVVKLRNLVPRVGRSAIYRTLNWLESQGRLRRVDTASGRNVFVRFDAQVVCLVECPTCGGVRQMDDVEVALHTCELASRSGFALKKALWVMSMPCRKHGKAKPT